jgi:hypothetical protein
VATQFKTLNITTLTSLTTAAPGNTTCKWSIFYDYFGSSTKNVEGTRNKIDR